MQKSITVLIGSPRKNGNTEILADAFISGAIEAGHNINKVTLYNRNIRPCIDCKSCYNNEGHCVRNDDMTELYELFQRTDILVLATPVYFYSFSTQLKSVLDRLHNPIRKKFPISECILLSVCADNGLDTFEPLVITYKAISGYLNWNDKGTILIDGVEDKGTVLNHPMLDEARQLGMSL